ncbi:transposase [Streptomyces sp. L-9-10]|uniref:transposase n=1 Tax=Streptomyces sp. L-9-10 TaxID=1478131 RepID=UPI001EFF6889|nr:transposase [Streptomyces sp. L-9-10]
MAEWPAAEDEPVQFWLSDLPDDIPLVTLVRLARLRRRIEHVYREMRQALGLTRFEARTWKGRHRHVTLVSVGVRLLYLQRLAGTPGGNGTGQ